MQVPERVPNRRVQNQLLEIVQDHCLCQVVNIHTREDKTLDLLLTNSPSPVNRVKGMPPIDKADHDIVYVEYDIKAKRIQQPRKRFSSGYSEMLNQVDFKLISRNQHLIAKSTRKFIFVANK